MMNEVVSKELARWWLFRCISCSEASLTVQLRAFGIEEPLYEQALHVFSGGFMHLGYACGLLTGTAVAAGILTSKRFADSETASAAALDATRQLVKAYPEIAGSIDCRKITEISLNNFRGRLRYVRKGKGRECGRYHIKWAFRAQQVIEQALAKYEQHPATNACANCAVNTMKKLAPSIGINEKDTTMVAGLAGGIGLSGNVCGALATWVFVLSISRYKKRNPEKRDSRLQAAFQELLGTQYRGAATRLQTAFRERFGSDLCLDIVGRSFRNIQEHSEFIEQGGCQEVMDFVVNFVGD